MAIIKEVELILSQAEEEVLLTSELDQVSDGGELLMVSVSSESDDMVAFEFSQSPDADLERIDEQAGVLGNERIQSFFGSIANMGRRSLRLFGAIGAKAKITVIRVSRALSQFLEKHSCDICKKITATLIRHALLMLGMPMLDEVTTEMATQITQHLTSSIDRIFDALSFLKQEELFQRLSEYINAGQDWLVGKFEDILDLQERITGRVCGELDYC